MPGRSKPGAGSSIWKRSMAVQLPQSPVSARHCRRLGGPAPAGPSTPVSQPQERSKWSRTTLTSSPPPTSSKESPTMSRLLHRLGHGSAAHPWRTISAWVLVAVAVFALAAAFGGTPRTTGTSPTPAPRSASTSSASTPRCRQRQRPGRRARPRRRAGRPAVDLAALTDRLDRHGPRRRGLRRRGSAPTGDTALLTVAVRRHRSPTTT